MRHVWVVAVAFDVAEICLEIKYNIDVLASYTFVEYVKSLLDV